MMGSELFIVCPFSGLEPMLQCQYGKNIYFLTYPGAVLQEQDLNFYKALQHLIDSKKIKTIYLVNDTNCDFTNAIIQRSKTFGFPVENLIEELYIEHYFSLFKDQSVTNQQYKLADLIIKTETNKLIGSGIIGPYIHNFAINIKGLITSKEKTSVKK